MTDQTNTLRTGVRSLRFRIMRLVVPVVMGTFLVIGFAAYTAVRGAAQDSLNRTHRENLGELANTVNTQFQDIADDLRELASSQNAREFARDTLISVANDSLEASQRRLLSDFSNTLQQHSGTYVALRYITYTGSVWSEATSYSGGMPIVDNTVHLNEMSNDAAVRRAVNAMLGQVIISELDFEDREGRFFNQGFPFIRFSTPVAAENDITNITGVIQLDVAARPLLTALQSAAESLSVAQPERRVLVLDSANRIITDSAISSDTSLSQLLRQTSPVLEAEFPDVSEYLTAQGTVTLVDPVYPISNQAVNVGSHLISTAEIQSPDAASSYWRLILIDSAALVQGFTNIVSIVVLLASAMIGAVICAIVYVILGRTLKPVSTLAQQWSAEVAGQPSGLVDKVAGMPIAFDQSYDEIQQLMSAFMTLANRVDELQRELQSQVGRYTRNLDIAARIGHETATLRDIDKLLNRAINLICEEFGFYHAQVFLLDDVGKNAVLVYSYGETGQKLLEQNFKIPVGSESVIGTVTATGQPLIINDTAKPEGPHRVNPLLPQTRAEMALPLQISDQIIGALDIQSVIANSFRAEELRTFQLLADQIALAIQNARLILQSEERIEQIDALNRRLTRAAWENVETQTKGGIYRYDLLKIERTDTAPTSETAMTVPITIRGEVIGTLEAQPEERGFSENDEIIMRAVADRVAIAIESARLFEQTQNSLAETSTLYELSRNLNEAETLEDIIRAVVVSVMPDATGGQIGVFEDYPSGASPEWMVITAEWVREGQDSAGTLWKGIRLGIDEHPLLKAMSSDQVTLVNDIDRDKRVDGVLRSILHGSEAQAMVLVPFSVRNIWRGVILIEFPHPREFSEREGRIYAALIDQAGVALDNRMLLQQNEMALAQIERLYSASRIINQSQTMQDLVLAAVTTSEDAAFNFEIASFEGELDSTGWPTRLRLQAYSQGAEVDEADDVYEVNIEPTSPLRAREPEIVQDSGVESTGIAAYVRARGYRFGAAFPMFSGNQPIALFSIVAPQTVELTEDDYDVYRALTGQMSTVLQNRQLLEATEDALDETRRLYAATRAITGASNAEGVYEAAASHLVTPTIPAHQISILMAGPSPTPEALYVEYAYFWTNSAVVKVQIGQRIASEEIAFAHLTEGNEGSVYFDNIRRDPPSQPALRSMFEQSGTGSAVITNIRTRQRWFGVFIVEAEPSRAFDEQYVRFTQALADQMALALESLLLFQEAQAQAQRALALAEAGQLATRIGAEFARSISEVFTRVAEAADYDRWLLALADDNGRLQRITYFNTALEAPDTSGDFYYDLRKDEPIVAAFRTDRQLLINEPASYPTFAKASESKLKQLGKQLVMPVRSGGRVIGVLSVGRALTAPDLDENDEQLVQTLAAQVAVAVENRRLFLTAEGERQTLRSILATLPTGVLVLDPHTLKPIQSNEQAEQLLGHRLDPDAPFEVARYGIYRTGTNSYYPEEDMPIYHAARDRQQASSDDIAVVQENGEEIDLLMNAAPILDASGEVNAIIVAFQDITALRSLENSLQQNLRETIALYETTRTLSEAEEADNVLDEIFTQFVVLEPSDFYIVLLDDSGEGARVVRSLSGVEGDFPLPGDMLDAHESLFVGDLSESTLDANAIKRLNEYNVTAYASMPMNSRSRAFPLGWLVLTFDTPQDFNPERAQFLNTLTETAAVALDNRYLFRSTEEALKETAALYKATTDISRVRSTEELSTALQDALNALSPDIYAAYVNMDGSLVELFNIDLDAAPAPFARMIEEHKLFQGQSAVYLEDLRSITQPTPFERDLLAQGNIRAFGMVLLRVQNLPAGCLIVAYHHQRHFSAGDARYLSAVADSTSVVVDNIFLLEQIQSALQETSALYQASRALSDADTPELVLNVMTTFLTERPISVAFLALLNTNDWHKEGAAVEVVASWQPEEDALNLQGITLTAEQYPAWELLASPEVLTIDDVTTAELSPLAMAGLESLGLRSVSILPLRVPANALGAIVLGGTEPYEHTDRDIRVYRQFAEQVSLRLEAARLLRQTERRAGQLATSAEVSQIASSILELDQLMPRIVDVIKESFGYDHAQIFLMDENDDYAELRASTGEAGQQLLSIKHRLQKGSRSVIGQVTATGLPVIAADTQDARVIHRPNPYLPNTRSEMAIPLILKDKIVGALDVQSNQANRFDEDDVAVLTTLASQISVAINNAQLYEQSQRRADEMTFLFNVTTEAAASTTLLDALQKVADALRERLKALSVIMYLPETYMDPNENIIVRLRPVALAGTDQPLSELSEVPLDAPNNLLAVTATQSHPKILNNLANEPNYLPVVADARSAIIVPMTAGGQLIALVAAESALVGAYNEDAQTLMLTLSGTLSAIVQNQQLLEQVQRTNEQLRELDRLKSDFLANMSHELRTPLNSIIGFSRVILKGIDGPLTEMQEQDLSTIYNSGLHLLNLINDILDQAKIAAGKMDLQVDYFEMKSVIDGVRSIGIGLVKDKPIDIYLDIAPGLGNAYGDEFRTRQVLLNLVSNAAKFTREGSITIRSYPVQDEETGRLMIRTDVIDTGIGIEEKDIPLLFEAFRQVDSSLTRTVGGTGLGLPIAKSLIEMQGGKMLVTSEVGVGSTFSILMPTEPPEEEAEGKKKKPTGELPELEPLNSPTNGKEDTGIFGKTNETTEAPAARMHVQHVKRQILLIEDNPDMVDQFRRTLQREGFDIFNASIPLEAEAMASGLHPTLIIMDVNFSDGAGWEILERLKRREDTIDIPVIVVSLSQEEERAMELGVHKFIRRPFMPDELVKAVLDAERESRVERILIIDDQPESVRLLQQMLDEQGKFRVFSATNGMEGIAMVARRRPNLIILDLRMPEMDGFQVIRELKNNPETATIPIIVVTGDTLNEEEMTQLSNMRVLYKLEMDTERYRQVLEEIGVKQNGGIGNG